MVNQQIEENINCNQFGGMGGASITDALVEMIHRPIALKYCFYPGNEYADILCLTNLPCLEEIRDSLCNTLFPKYNESHTPA